MNLTLPILPRLFARLESVLLAPPLSKQVNEHVARRNEALQRMRAIEDEILRLRQAVAEKKISLFSVTSELREWVGYSDETYYKAMSLEYRKRMFDADSERVEKMATVSRKRTVVTDDGRGNIVSETTTASGKAPLSNAVEFEVG